MSLPSAFSGLAPFDHQLGDLAAQSRRRALSPRAGVDFSSNDYLGLANCARLRKAVGEALARGTPVGATGSRLLRGNAPEHEELEAFAARFFGAERSLYFGSGYAANHALLSTLPQRGDLVILDELLHASANEGARAGRAQFCRTAHNDADAVESRILEYRAAGGTGRVWVAVESLYSMDGDRAPLPALATLAQRHEAFLLIDEAHATGVFGSGGRGLASGLEGQENVVVLHTCGKALGGSGALLTGSRTLIDFLINRARAFIYATAPSPLMAVAAHESLRIVEEEPERRERLMRQVTLAARGLSRVAPGLKISGSQIQPIRVGEEARAMRLAARLQQQGFDIRAVRPPTVPAGTSRLRLSITLNATEQDIHALLEALGSDCMDLPA